MNANLAVVTDSNGSQATVNYTVAGGSNQQFSISFRCNSSNDNYVTAGGTLTGLTVTPLYSAAMVLAMHPLIGKYTELPTLDLCSFLIAMLVDTETVSQAPPPFKGH